jgi:hypothetical protein
MLSRKSSSFHTLNSDFKLSNFNKYLYLFLNAFVGFLPSKSSGKFSIEKFHPSLETAQKVASEEIGAVSPARFLSNIFWESIDYEILTSLVGSRLRVLELGCGTGVYGEKILKLTENSSYTGVDIRVHPNWDQLDPLKFRFLKDTYENFDLLASNQNLIITQSALEHFENDISLFEKINSYANSCDFPVVSIHLMPSACSLYTYLWHGIRQYGRLHTGRLSSASSDCSRYRIYTLGGCLLNWFHFRNITFPQILHKTALISQGKDRYYSLLLKAAKRDGNRKSTRFSVFTAVVIVWNTNDSDSSFIPSYSIG